MKGWAWFVVVELICFIAMVVGWFLLIPFAAGRRWYWRCSEHYPLRIIAVWNWNWVDKVWGNSEDGVTGAEFYVKRIGNERWRAYCWSAWRNSSNNLRWVFAWPGGPYVKWQNAIWKGHIGFKPMEGWPVLSANLNK
jgi:hypothetical protein